MVIMARKQLPKGHTLVQHWGGTDHLERSFNESRSKNANATAQGTDGQMANIQGAALQSMAGSRGANVGKQKSFRVAEIEGQKVKKRKMVAQVPARVPAKTDKKRKT
jgi:hypothetical protein